MDKKYHVLTDGNTTLKIELECGNIVGFASKNPEWKILDREHLGKNFELMIPIKDKRNNVVDGSLQKLFSYKIFDNGIKLCWKDICSLRLGILDIEIGLEIKIRDGGLLFTPQIINNSGYEIEMASIPRFGDIRKPKNAEQVKIHSTDYAFGVYPDFYCAKGYYGVDNPIQVSYGPAGPTWPFACFVCDEKFGLYFSDDNCKDAYLSYRMEQRPGHDASMFGVVPKGDFIDGHEVFVTLDFPQFCFCKEGEAILSPVYFKLFYGDWTAAADIYKELKKSWGWKPHKLPKWLDEPHTWLQLHVNSPENELRMRFSELPSVARQCVESGISVIQYVGWNDGGQDAGNPSHSFDPKLGTFKELKDAIEECQKMGVRIVLFSKFVWADKTTEWYKKELTNYSLRDLNGEEFYHPGYQYQTATQFQNLNVHRFAPMCFHSEKYLDICVNEFKKIVALGADGTLFDECFHKGGAHICCAENHGHRKGVVSYTSDNNLIEEFKKVSPKDFMFAGEELYDRLNLVYDLAYIRSWGEGHKPVRRYIGGGTRFMTALTGFDDREMLNQCLLYQYIPSYEPFHFKGLPSDFKKTIAYGKKIMALRKETAETTWYGEMLMHKEVKVEFKKDAKIQYCAYKSEKGRRAVVIVNNGKAARLVRAEFENGKIDRFRSADGKWQSGNEFKVPPRGVIVALEEDR